MLAFYSSSLIPAVLFEGCICTLILNQRQQGSLETEEIELQSLHKSMALYADLFQNESLHTFVFD